jgi:ketosteroid isomerase-like protein
MQASLYPVCNEAQTLPESVVLGGLMQYFKHWQTQKKQYVFALSLKTAEKSLMFIILPVLIMGIISCQLDQHNEKTDLGQKKSEPLTAVLLQASLQSDLIPEQTTENTSLPTKNYLLPIAGIFAKDVTLLAAGDPEDIPLAGMHSGRKAVNEYFSNFLEKINVSEVVIQATMAEGIHLDIHIRLRGYVHATSNTFDLEFVYAITQDEKEIRSIVIYYDTFNFRRALLEMSHLFVTDVQNPTQPVYNPLDPNDYRPLVEAGIRAFFVDKDVPALLNLAHPDIYWMFKGNAAVVPYAGLYHGYTELTQFLNTCMITYYPLEITFTGSVQQGNRLDYFVEEHGYAVPTGKEFRIRMLHTYLIQDNKALEFKSINDSYTVA